MVGIIAPWNFPLTLSFADVIPALMAGNTVVIKPSSATPLTVLAMWRIFMDSGFPKDVLQVIPATGQTAGELIDSVDMIAFTGSTEIGKKIAERAGKRLIPILLELGGKDPMIVLKDANIERAVNAGVWDSLLNSGQVCMSTERIYVQEQIADEFIDRVVGKVRSLRQGYSKDFNCDIGSMTSSEQLEIVKDQINDAVSKGAKILIGGKRTSKPGKGYFFEPTVVVDVNHNMKLMTEETFGPIIAIQRVRDEEEAINLANDSCYGLGSSIWTKDKRKGRKLARGIQSGFVCINDVLSSYMVMELPFGGLKESGLSMRHGPEGIRNFCNTQSVVIDRLGLNKDFGWYPYSPSINGKISRVLRLLYCRGLKKIATVKRYS
ncbi:MAG: aldehyde dehydrogenase family protein [Spirochaetota bacterium]|nr:aldehyde dehydrogenase family protein [Spirochaetota bacterium]